LQQSSSLCQHKPGLCHLPKPTCPEQRVQMPDPKAGFYNLTLYAGIAPFFVLHFSQNYIPMFCKKRNPVHAPL
ncbi:MAG: hypothetical protein ACXVPN_15170, partial [Bacteroidia bacterium]